MDVKAIPPVPIGPPEHGTQSLVIHSGESLYLSDYVAQRKTSQKAYYVDEKGVQSHEEVPEEDNITRSALMVPLRHENQVIGVLQVFSYRKDDFTEENLRFLESFSPQVAAATSNARLHEQVERQLQNLDALHKIDKAITSSLDLRVTLNVILGEVITQLRVDAADVLLYNPITLTLEFVTGRGFRTDALQHTQLKLGQGHAGRAAMERRIFHIPNLKQKETGFLRGLN